MRGFGIGILSVVAAVAASPGMAQTQPDDRAAANRAAMRQMFPILNSFDRAAGRNTATAAVTPVAQRSGNPAPASAGVAAADIAHADIAGVTLGMSRDQALAAVKAHGYAPHGADFRDPTFQSEVARTRQGIDPAFKYAMQLGTPKAESLLGPQGQMVTLSYVQTQAGPRVDEVTYTVQKAVMPFATLEQASVRKYGRPTAASDSFGRHVLWCERACTDSILNPTGNPNITLSGGGTDSFMLSLSDGQLLRDRTREAVKAAAAAAVGPARPAF